MYESVYKANKPFWRVYYSTPIFYSVIDNPGLSSKHFSWILDKCKTKIVELFYPVLSSHIHKFIIWDVMAV